MGFWDVTKRLLTGKRGFEAPPPDTSWDNDAPTADYADDKYSDNPTVREQPSTSLYDSGGYKHVPEATLRFEKNHVSGSRVEIWATIENHSERPLDIDKVVILGARREIDYPLGPHGSREFKIFSGQVPTHDHYTKAELHYKDHQTGDYFRADHVIEYHYESDKTYSVVEFKPIHPIKDI